MVKHNQSGAVNSLVISLVMAVVLLVGALGFSAWAFNSRQDYKNNVDAKVTAAVATAKQHQSALDTAQAAKAAKQPLRTYTGPEAYGSIVVNFPKTWSAYVDSTGTGTALVNGYFAPTVVPSIGDQSSIFALRIQILSEGYSQTLQNLASQQKSGKITVAAYSLPSLPKVVGVKVVGQLASSLTAAPTTTMVILPLRSDTLEISTQGTQYLDDFNNSILQYFSFSP